MDYDPSRRALLRPCEDAQFFPHGRPASTEALCAELARPVYCDDAGLARSVLAAVGFIDVAFVHSGDGFDGRGTQAFLATAPDLSVLAFRGTESDDPTDIIDDARFLPEPWPGGGKVHRGFADALDRVWSELAVRLAQVTGTLAVTGHSLGAALATLAAGRNRPDRLVTFGSPRVGDDDFVRHLTEHMAGGPIDRFVNCCDLVTEVPPGPYRHVGTRHYIDRTGAISTDMDEAAISADRHTARADYLRDHAWRFGNVLVRDLADHAPVNYVSAVFAGETG